MEDSRGASQTLHVHLFAELTILAAQKLLDQTKGADLSALLSLQHQLLLSLHVALTTPIDEPHYHLFDEVWVAGELEDTDETNRWRRLGFKTEAPQYEFEGAGLLGLKALKRFADDSQNEFAQVRWPKSRFVCAHTAD